tara:strand:+ start:104 stop:322 length:219 start_codon:yes stop_codon:yes gene_type:complete
MKYVIIILLLPFNETFKVNSKLWLYEIEATSCDTQIVTKFHEDVNKHELVIDGKRWQKVGQLCGKKEYSVYN